jgi:hypothetical protein
MPKTNTKEADLLELMRTDRAVQDRRHVAEQNFDARITSEDKAEAKRRRIARPPTSGTETCS